MDKVELIKSHRYLKDLNPEHLKALAGCGNFVQWEADAKIFEIGETATQFYLLISGSVELFMPSAMQGDITIQKIHAGDLLGWSWLFPPHKWHFAAKAQESTVALAFDATAFSMLCEQDVALSAAIYQRISRIVIERLQATRLQLIEMSEKGDSNHATN